MFVVYYRDRVQIDSWRVRDESRVVRLSRCWFSGGLLYGWRDQFNVVALSADLVDDIEDTSTGALVNVAGSFAAGRFVYDLPF